MNKNQQKNRMGAVIILLAAACLNGYATVYFIHLTQQRKNR